MNVSPLSDSFEEYLLTYVHTHSSSGGQEKNVAQYTWCKYANGYRPDYTTYALGTRTRVYMCAYVCARTVSFRFGTANLKTRTHEYPFTCALYCVMIAQLCISDDLDDTRKVKTAVSFSRLCRFFRTHYVIYATDSSF